MFNNYPYTDFHELNLDWILREIMKLHHSYDEFKALNTITNAGAWDITKQYQAWTVVSDNNAGYISLKPVPAGIAITNTEYWGLIADYDILITDLSNRISALEGRCTSLEGRTTKLERQVNNRRIILIGDSWGDPQNDPFYRTWSTQLIEANPTIDFYRNCNNASGFDQAGELGQTFGGLFVQLVPTIDNVDEIDDVIVIGGSNDRGHLAADVETAIETFCLTTVRTYCPKARIHIGFCGWTNVIDATAIGDHADFKICEDAYKTCQKYGASFIPGLENLAKDYDNYYNSGHMNTTGMAAIAAYLTSYIVGGSATYDIKKTEITYSLNAAYTSSDLKISQERHDDQTICHVYADTVGNYRGVITFNNVSSQWILTAGTWGKICDFSSGLIGCGDTVDPISDFSTTVAVQFQTQGSGSNENDLVLPMRFFITGGALYFQVFFEYPDQLAKVESVQQFYVPSFDIIIPTASC